MAHGGCGGCAHDGEGWPFQEFIDDVLEYISDTFEKMQDAADAKAKDQAGIQSPPFQLDPDLFAPGPQDLPVQEPHEDPAWSFSPYASIGAGNDQVGTIFDYYITDSEPGSAQHSLVFHFNYAAPGAIIHELAVPSGGQFGSPGQTTIDGRTGGFGESTDGTPDEYGATLFIGYRVTW